MALAGCVGPEVLKKLGRAYRSCKVFLMLPTPPCIHPAPAGPRLVEVEIQEYNCLQCPKTFHYPEQQSSYSVLTHGQDKDDCNKNLRIMHSVQF